MRFIPHTPDDVREMLAAIGVSSVEALFEDIPAELRTDAAIDLPDGLAESAVLQQLQRLADRNGAASCLSFLGGGAYPHFVPAIVDAVLQRAEFYSAYTPYQPEVSQGTLQAVFEFQTLVSMLFDLDVANASMYDGASATGEAVLMALRVHPKRRRVVLARSLHPQYREVTATYLQGSGDFDVLEAPFGKDGRVDLAWLEAAVDAETAAVVVGYPNFFGVVEDLVAVRRSIGTTGAMLITATAEPLALALLRPPGSAGAEIAVAEGQSFGVPLSYGGPGVGLFATRTRHVRSMPGRLVGETRDHEGRRGFVLTLATREQHIRRERATSNICTNHGLIALAVSVYLSTLGKFGLRGVAQTNLRNAHEAERRLCASAQWARRFDAPFFNEFVLHRKDGGALLAAAQRAGVLGGLSLGRWYPELENCVLIAVTEMHSAEDVERLAEALQA